MSDYEYEAAGEAVCEECGHAIQVRGPDDSSVGVTMTVETKEQISDADGFAGPENWFEHDCVFSEYCPYEEPHTVEVDYP